MKKKKLIIFSFSFFILILTSIIFMSIMVFNLNDFYIKYKKSGLLPQIDIGYISSEYDQELNIPLEDIKSVEFVGDGLNDVEFILETGAQDSIFEYSFKGDYTFEDGNLKINQMRQLGNGFNAVYVYVDYDIADYTNGNMYSNYVDDTILTKYINDLNKKDEYLLYTDYSEIIDEYKDKIYVMQDLYDTDLYEVYIKSYESSIIEFENYTIDDLINESMVQGIIIQNIDYSENIGSYNLNMYIELNSHRGKKMILNDDLGYEFEFEDEEFILNDLKKGKTWKFPIYKRDYIEQKYKDLGTI